MKQIDLDGSGMIDRIEWREKWVSMQKILGLLVTFSKLFKTLSVEQFHGKDVKMLKEETFGEEKDKPLYAYSNQISFFRLPIYPEKNRPKGN